MRRWIFLLCVSCLVGGLVSCNLPATSTPTAGGIDSIRTAAARTLDAIRTTMITPQVTPNPTRSGTLTQPSVAPTAPATARPGVTASAVGTSQPCDQVSFVKDVTIPDGTLLAPGTAFIKTWELKNSGSCAWNSLYTLVFANQGDPMGGQVSQPLIASGAVQPGESVKISVGLIAPASQGDFKGYWQIRSPAGVNFGPAGKTFWVAIKVSNQVTLLDNLCNAQWSTAAGEVGCPGKAGAGGGAYRVENPKFASGYQDDEPTLAMEPPLVKDGVLQGVFPPVRIDAAASHFRTIIGCAFDAKACNANVRITAQVGSEPAVKLGDWVVAYDQEWAKVNVDMAALGLVGKSVTLVFTVSANGSPTQDRVYLLSPGFFKP